MAIPNWSDIAGYFQQALSSLTGDTEQMYQQGKRRTLSDIASQSIQAGLANTINLPAAGIAYDSAVRPATNLALGTAKAGILQNFGSAATQLYGVNTNATLSGLTTLAGSNPDWASDQKQVLANYIASLRG